MKHFKKTYVGGHVLHRSGGGILLDAKRDVPVKELEGLAEQVQKSSGLTSAALKRLESLKPKEIVTKRPNIKF